jgi:hypothetical protein
MKKFTLILESEFLKEKNLLFQRIRSLDSWLYTTSGLGLMNIIEDIFEEQGWATKISLEEVASFNKCVNLLKKTNIDNNWIESRIRNRVPGGIENKKLVKDEVGKWHPVNKLNTNHSDLSDMLSEMIIRSIEQNKEKGMQAYKDIMDDPRNTLLRWKPSMKKLLEKYFIKFGDGLEDFKKFTKFSKRFSEIGEETENSIISILEDNNFEIHYHGKEGDFVDMIFGVDIIVFRSDFGIKTIQVKSNIKWDSIQYYKVDWIANSNKIFDKETRKEINLEESTNYLFQKISETIPD